MKELKRRQEDIYSVLSMLIVAFSIVIVLCDHFKVFHISLLSFFTVIWIIGGICLTAYFLIYEKMWVVAVYLLTFWIYLYGYIFYLYLPFVYVGSKWWIFGTLICVLIIAIVYLIGGGISFALWSMHESSKTIVGKIISFIIVALIIGAALMICIAVSHTIFTRLLVRDCFEDISYYNVLSEYSPKIMISLIKIINGGLIQ